MSKTKDLSVEQAASLTRRDFFKTAAKAGALIAFPAIIPASALGRDGAVAPSERIVLAGIGIGGRGQYDLTNFLGEPDVHFAAIADIRAVRREAIKQMAEAKYGKNTCDTYIDMREMLERKDIDAVLIATGDRWHTMASITAAKAGKDIYCEKPFSMTISESRALANTIQRYSRVFQAGTQRRSIDNFIFARQLVLSGKLGKIHTVHANTLDPPTRHEWLPAETEPSREEVDWNMWLGPCPWRPYNKAYVEGHWRNHFDFHGGGILEWGSHTVDLCQWALNMDDTVPVQYEPTPEGCLATYANGIKLVMRSSGWMGLGTCSVRYEGDAGWVETGDNGDLLAEPASLLALRGAGSRERGTDSGGHIRNFLDCVKSRAQPNSNADVACNSHIASHAAYIAWQLGKTLTFDPAKEEFVGNDEANRMRSRAMREPWRI